MALAAIGIEVALHATLSFQPLIGALALPVLLAGYLWGMRAGLVATATVVVGSIACDAWFGPAAHQNVVFEAVRIGSLAIVGVAVSLIIGKLHASRRLAQRDAATLRTANLALTQSEERLQQTFEACPLPYAMLRLADRRFVAANEAFLTFFGFERGEVVGQLAASLHMYPSEEDAAAFVERVRSGQRVHDEVVRVQRRNGDIRLVRFSTRTVDLDGAAYALGVFFDITDRQRAIDLMRESEERFAKAFEASPLAMTLVRACDDVVVAANDAHCRLFEYTDRDQLIGRTTSAIEGYAGPPGPVRDYETQLQLRSGKVIDTVWNVERIEIGGEPHVLCVIHDITARKQAEAAMQESDARFIDIAHNMRDVFWVADPTHDRILYVSPRYEEVWQRACAELYADSRAWLRSVHPDDVDRVRAAMAGQADGKYDVEFRVMHADGSARWIRDRGFPVYDEHGTLLRIAGLAEDITQRHELEEQLRQTQKLESLGLLAGGIAHDFNNLLAVIASSSGLLAETIPAGAAEREFVDEIDAAVDRATSMTRQLLAFSRKQAAEPRVVDVNGAVNDTRKMLRRMVGEDILLQTSLDPDLRHVRIDPGNLIQVLMNLVVNARDAMPRGGTLVLTTRNAQDRVLLEVADTGSGMSSDVLVRIFEPFFTTKAAGHGTGMGLAVVHGIIEQAGGHIEVASTPGEGTTFRVYLPAVDAQVDTAIELAGAMALGIETILLVDDDVYVRRVAARALRMRGYTVLEASDGRAALTLLDDHVDLLLTDVVMPNMDGRELAEAARIRRPELKVLYTSGYTDDAVVRHGVVTGEVELIEKPFRVSTLARRVRQMLDAA